MEELMYFVWQQRLAFPSATLAGEPLDIVHPGLRNLDAGPDFFNAKLKMNGMIWAGNVEMHVKASDWLRHHHETDSAYNSVILHVVLEADTVISHPDGTPMHTAVMQIPDKVLEQYRRLCEGQSASVSNLLPGQTPSYSWITCRSLLPEVPSMIMHDWMTALCTQRMLQKMQRVKDLIEGQMCSWTEALYVVLTRSLGTGVNSDAMERLARSLPLNCLLHHRDNLLQLRALLLGQAGLLDEAARLEEKAHDIELLRREYAFLRQKFQLTPLPSSAWRLGRIRPQAHPVKRLNALAHLLLMRRDLFSDIMDATSLEQLERALSTDGLGRQTVRSLVINAAVPLQLSYAQWQGDQERSERALNLLEELPPEKNRYITQWQETGVTPRSALDTQALLHLTLHYCQPHKCLRCRVGCWCLKHHCN